MAPRDGTLAEFAYRKCYVVQMIFRRTLLAGLLVFAVASCGGDDSSSVSDMIEEATSDTGGSGDASDDQFDMDNYEATGNDCVDAATALGVALGSLGNAMTGADWDLETYRKNMDIARTAIADSARADFDIVAGAYGLLAEALEEVNAAGGIQSPEGSAILAEAGSEFDDAELQAAADRLGTYYATECLEYYGMGN